MKAELKIAMIQDQPGSGIRDPYWKILLEKRPHILAFPEYFFVKSDENDVINSGSRHNSDLKELIKWSTELDCAIVGGSLVAERGGKLYNSSYFVNKGRVAGYYNKIHPYRNEGGGRISKGTEYKTFDLNGVRIGILICADVLFPDSFRNIRGLRPDIIFVPTTSPYRENESAEVKFARDNRLFVEGARVTGSRIFKVCASGRIGSRRFQARSLVATPAGIAWRNPPEDEDKSMLVYARVDEPGNNPRLDIEAYRH